MFESKKTPRPVCVTGLSGIALLYGGFFIGCGELYGFTHEVAQDLFQLKPVSHQLVGQALFPMEARVLINLSSSFFHLQQYFHPGALTQGTLHLNAAVHELNQLLGDGHAQTRSL